MVPSTSQRSERDNSQRPNNTTEAVQNPWTTVPKIGSGTQVSLQSHKHPRARAMITGVAWGAQKLGVYPQHLVTTQPDGGGAKHQQKW